MIHSLVKCCNVVFVTLVLLFLIIVVHVAIFFESVYDLVIHND